MKYFLSLIILFSLTVQASYIIPDGGVTTAKLANSAVTTIKLNDGAVTPAKRAALGQQISSSSGTFNSSSGSPVDVTNLTVTITTTGRPVFIGLIGDGTTNQSFISSRNNSERTGVDIYLKRGSTTVFYTKYESQAELSAGYNHIFSPPSIVGYVDTPAAGTYTYKIQADEIWTGSTLGFYFYYVKLIAYEL